MDRYLGRLEPAEIAIRVANRFRIERTATAVVQRLKRRGRSRWMEGLSLRDLGRIFGMDHRSITRWWIEPGLLVGRRWSGRGPHRGWLFVTTDVERFIRKHLYAIRVDRMQASHALTRMAIVEERRQHWCSSRELAAYLGVPVDAIRKAARAGLIPHYRRPGAGRYGEIRVRANNFCLISEHFR